MHMLHDTKIYIQIMRILNSISNEQKGTLYAITSGLCYGLLGYFGMSIINANFSVANTTFWRFLVSSCVMGVALLPQYKVILNNPHESLKILLYGALFYSPGAMVYFVSSKYIGTGLAIVIFFTFPVIVILINWLFFKTKVSLIYYISIALIILGLALLVDIKTFEADILGIVLSFISAICYAIYIVVSKRNTLPPLHSAMMLCVGCTITSFLYAYFDGSFVVPQDARIWLDIFGIGIICTALPIIFLLQGLKYISTEKVSILSVLEPISVVLVGIALLGETITTMQTFGIIIILTGAMITMASHM